MTAQERVPNIILTGAKGKDVFYVFQIHRGGLFLIQSMKYWRRGWDDDTKIELKSNNDKGYKRNN